MKNKFFNFVFEENKTNSADLYVYGALIGGVDKWDESDVTFQDFRSTLETLSDGATLNMYINSCGGDVFTTQAIVAMLRRSQERNITINAYVDGIGASCASWLPMCADNIYIYPQSILMIHKPLCSTYGNANDMMKEVAVLDKIENDVIIPLYLEKTKEGITAEMLQEKMAKETWLSSDEIMELFNVTLLKDERKITACLDKEIFKNFINVPSNLQELLNKEEEVADNMAKIKKILDNAGVEPTVDPVEGAEPVVEGNEPVEGDPVEGSDPIEGDPVEPANEPVENEAVVALEMKVKSLEEEKAALENKLDESNKKVLALNDKVNELQPVVDKYNAELTEKQNAENETILNEKREYFRNKFEQLGAKAKFESEEIQNLVSNCVADEAATGKLNLMLVEMISTDGTSAPINRVEVVSKIENLIPVEDTIETKYGFE